MVFFPRFGSAQPGALGVRRDINSDGKFMAESFPRDLFIFHKIFFYHYENVFHRLRREPHRVYFGDVFI